MASGIPGYRLRFLDYRSRFCRGGDQLSHGPRPSKPEPASADRFPIWSMEEDTRTGLVNNERSTGNATVLGTKLNPTSFLTVYIIEMERATKHRPGRILTPWPYLDGAHQISTGSAGDTGACILTGPVIPAAAGIQSPFRGVNNAGERWPQAVGPHPDREDLLHSLIPWACRYPVPPSGMDENDCSIPASGDPVGDPQGYPIPTSENRPRPKERETIERPCPGTARRYPRSVPCVNIWPGQRQARERGSHRPAIPLIGWPVCLVCSERS